MLLCVHCKALLRRECPPKFNRAPKATGKDKQTGKGSITGSNTQQLLGSSTGEEMSFGDSTKSDPGDQEESRNPAASSETSSSVGSDSSSASSAILSLPKLPHWYFDTAEDLKDIPDCDVYLQPNFPKFPAIDASVISGTMSYLFQMTRDSKHSINADICKVLAFSQSSYRCSGFGSCQRTCSATAASTSGKCLPLMERALMKSRRGSSRTACRLFRSNIKWQ